MKIANRVLALVMSLLMIVGSCAIAASAATSAQAAVNAAKAGDTVKLTGGGLTVDTLVINKDLTVDLCGGTLRGPKGAVTITIGNNAKVTIKNGEISSYFANVSTMEMIKTIEDDSPCAIRVNSGNVTLEGVRVLGGFTRIPTTKDDYVPTASAVKVVGGANLTLKNATLVGGRYGVDNKLEGSVPGGKVYIEDAIIVGLLDAIKDWSKETLLGCKRVNATDHIMSAIEDVTGALSADQKKAIDMLLDDRMIVYTQGVAEDHVAKITVENGIASVEATVDASNSFAGADCSYLLVPQSLLLANGKKIALTKVGDTYVADKIDTTVDDVTDAEVVYMTSFEIASDLQDYFDNFFDYVDKAFDAVIGTKDAEYADLAAMYDEYVAKFAEIFSTLDEVGANTVLGVDLSELDAYKNLMKALFKLGGQTLYNASTGEDAMGGSALWYFGEYLGAYEGYDENKLSSEPGEVYGTLDKIDNIKKEFEAFGSLANTAMWGDLAAWACDKVPELVDILKEAKTNLAGLNAALSDSAVSAVADFADFGEYTEQLKEAQKYLDSAIRMIETDGQEYLDLIEEHKGDVKGLVEDAVDAYNNLDKYVKLDEFVEGNLLKVYTVKGATEVEIIETSNLILNIEGAGEVLANGKTYDDLQNKVAFDGSITLTATGDQKFLYWVNEESDRILSTEKSYTLTTTIDKEITAVFASDDASSATMVSPSGLIYAVLPVVEGVVYVDDMDDPTAYVAGATFKGWPCDEDGEIDVVGNATENYYAGNSAFATASSAYTGEGYILKVNATDAKNFIVTPKYEISTTFHVWAYNGVKYLEGKNIPYGNVVTLTPSTTAGFSYWMDADSGAILSVHPTYKMQVVRNVNVTAVFNASPVRNAVNVTTVVANGNKISIYAEKTAKDTVLSCGIMADTDASKLTVENATSLMYMSTSKNTSNQSLFVLSVDSSATQNGSLYVRPYLEVMDAEGNVSVIYGSTRTIS